MCDEPKLKEPQWKDMWFQFARVIEKRLDQGHREYGDGSFDMKPSTLLFEIEQELLDLVGWGYILWCRLQKLKDRADGLQ